MVSGNRLRASEEGALAGGRLVYDLTAIHISSIAGNRS
jgi:hypothetical protein